MKPPVFAPLLMLVLVPLAYSGGQQPAADPQPGHSVHGDPFNEGPRQAAQLMGGTGKVSFPVSTRDGKAQDFFDQGIGLLHGFWYYEAERSFRQVAALDPDCAMAYWGMAMANFNNEKRAKPFIAEASKRKDKVDAREKSYIDALAAYFAGAKKDNVQLRRDLVKNYEQMVKNDPSDLEAKAFLLWQMWDNSEHKVPIPSKPAMNKLISEVLDIEPMHPVHHYRVHITNPNNADRSMALASAALCGQAAPMVPHMWHMPGHTYSDSQRYADGAWQQEAALRVEHAHMIRYRMLVDETYLFIHNRRWLIDNLSYVGRVDEAIDLCKHMVDLPRTPKFGQGAATEGRKKLLELLLRHERWEELVRLHGTDYLEAGQGAEQHLRRLVVHGQACFATGNFDKGNERLAAVKEMLANPLAARTKAADEAEAKARAQNKSDAEIAKLRAEAEKRATVPAAKLEKAEAELLGYEALAKGDAKAALALLQKAGVGPEQMARVQADAGDFAKALAQTQKTDKRVYKVANRVYALHKAGKADEARKTFEELRVLAGEAELGDRALMRLQPLARELKWPADWRTPKPADDVGERPRLDTLGPFRWQPWVAPEWSLPDLDGKSVSSKDFRGKPIVLILYLGFGCVHCVEQLKAFAPMKADFEMAGIAVVAISTDELKMMQSSAALPVAGGKLPFPILADPRLEVFKAFRSYDDFERAPMHGTFLIDGSGRLRWQDIRFEPFRDPAFLLSESQRLLALPEERLVP